MANSIAKIQKYGAELLDEMFAKESCTAILEGNLNLIKFVNANTVLLPSITMDGLGDYSRSTGYASGDVTVTWTSYTLSKDRSKKFMIDAMDDEETAGVAFGDLSKQFMKTKVVPEVDAYRLSTLASKGTVTAKTIAANTVISEFNTILKGFQDDEVGIDNLVGFISTDVDLLIANTSELNRVVPRQDLTDEKGVVRRARVYEGIPLIVCPPDRFKTAYTFGTNGYTAASGAVALHCLFVDKNSAIPVKKHENIKVINPEVNQAADGWIFAYRLYHDIFTPKNKTKGIRGLKASA